MTVKKFLCFAIIISVVGIGFLTARNLLRKE
jgi:hypothetical protein